MSGLSGRRWGRSIGDEENHDEEGGEDNDIEREEEDGEDERFSRHRFDISPPSNIEKYEEHKKYESITIGNINEDIV